MTRKEEFQREGNVASERKGRIVSDGKGWSSARKEGVESSMTRRGRGRGGRKGRVERCSIQYKVGGSCMKKGSFKLTCLLIKFNTCNGYCDS